MSLPTAGWKNKAGTGNRLCKCGSWTQHWLNFSDESWPKKCSVDANLIIITVHSNLMCWESSIVLGGKL